MNGNVIRTITIRGQSEGLDKLTADINKLATAQENVAVVSEQSAKRVLSLEDAWKRQTMKLDEAARAQANIARETKIADAALREGIATQAQHAQRLEQINQRYNLASTATKGFTQQTGLARHELINLGRQAQDVGVSLVSGQSPLMVLAQQGAQIADVFISSGKSVGSFFTQAINWAKPLLMSTGGIVTAVLGIGAAAIYTASQFARASTTIEEALKEQNRLLEEGKKLLDARTSLEAKAQLQSKAQTQFETMRNQLDLQLKLNKAMEEAVKLSEGRATTPTQVPGEMGEAPTGFRARSSPGMEQMTAAFLKLQEAQAAGLPGLKEYNAELARIGLEAMNSDPALVQIIADMLKAGEAGLQLEFAALRAKALSDALAGVATNAQLAAVGLGSIAQFQLNNAKAEQAAAALERQAVAVLQMAQAYPGMSIEVAKQLDTLQGSLQVAEARTGAERIITQELVTIRQLLLEGKTLEEATAVAAGQRAIAEANVSTQIQNQIHGLQQQTQLSQARMSGGPAAEARVKGEQAYTNAIREGASAEDARGLQSATLANEKQQQAEQQAKADEQQAKADAQAEEAAAKAIANIRTAEDAWRLYEEGIVSWSVAHDYAIERTLAMEDAIQRTEIAMARAAQSAKFWAKTMAQQIDERMNLMPTQFENTTGTYEYDPLNIRARKEAADLTVEQLGYGTVVPVKRGIGLSEYTDYEIDWSNMPKNEAELFGEKTMKELQEAFDRNLQAVNGNTDALNSMTDVLSPFYSSDPRKTALGFRAFAGGGIMTAHGELPLKQYAGGGIATSPQVAIFGEGSTPEAYVPAPGGQIPVVIKTPANNNQRPITVNINIRGNADGNTVAALKSTAFQQAQAMRRVRA